MKNASWNKSQGEFPFHEMLCLFVFHSHDLTRTCFPGMYWVLPCSCSCPKSSIITICDQQMDPANQVRSLNITPLTLLSFCFTWIPLAVISVPRSSNNWPLCHVLRKLVKATQRQKGIPLSIYDVVPFSILIYGICKVLCKTRVRKWKNNLSWHPGNNNTYFEISS